LQVLDAHHRVVLADRGRGLVQVVAAGVADAGIDALDAGKALLVLVEAIERRDERAIGEGGEAGNADIDPDGARRLGITQAVLLPLLFEAWKGSPLLEGEISPQSLRCGSHRTAPRTFFQALPGLRVRTGGDGWRA
jgi:hypothetical protein